MSTGERSYHVQPRRHVVRMCSACVLLSRKKKKEKKKGKKKNGRSPNRVVKIESGNKWSRGPLPLFDSFVDEFLEPTKLGSLIENRRRQEEEEEEEGTEKKLTAKVCPKSWTAPRCEVEDIDRRVFSSRPEPTP